MRAKEVPFKRHPIGGRAGPEEPRSLYVRTLPFSDTLRKTPQARSTSKIPGAYSEPGIFSKAGSPELQVLYRLTPVVPVQDPSGSHVHCGQPLPATGKLCWNDAILRLMTQVAFGISPH